MPSFAVDLTSFTPSIPLTASSITKITPFSTSSGLAPGYGTMIDTMSRSNSGKTSCFMCIRLTAPTRIRTAAARLAAT